MLESEDYLGKDAVELSAGIRAGDYSVVEVTECAINRAEKVESSIHSIVTQNFERALETAKIIDNSAEYLQKSILAGFPFLIKDLSTVKGLPATFGSNLFKDNKANISSNIVQKYLNLEEFKQLEQWHMVLNPFHQYIKYSDQETSMLLLLNK